MKIHRILDTSSVELDLDRRLPEPRPDEPLSAWNDRVRGALFPVLADLLGAADAVTNETKLAKDFNLAEQAATTAIGNGVAIPHVRTLRCRHFAMAFARSRDGFVFSAVDGLPVQYVAAVIAPPYDEQDYRALYTAVAQALNDDTCRTMIDSAETADDVIWALQSYL